MEVSREVPLGHAARAEATADATRRACRGIGSGTRVSAADDHESRSGGFRERHAAEGVSKRASAGEGTGGRSHVLREGW